MEQRHVEQSMCLGVLIPISFCLAIKVHLELPLLFHTQLRAFVCPMTRRATVEAVQLPSRVRLRCSLCIQYSCGYACGVACTSTGICLRHVASIAFAGTTSAASSAPSACASLASSLKGHYPRVIWVCPVRHVHPACLIVPENGYCLVERVGVLVHPQQIVVHQLIFELPVSLLVRSADDERCLDSVTDLLFRGPVFRVRDVAHDSHSPLVLKYPLNEPLLHAGGASERLLGVPHALEVSSVFLYALFFSLGVEVECLHGL